jgi:metal-responsive CopG/Arc/MetJ family transcriptional regulator
MKKRISVMIELDVLDRLRSIKSRTGISDSEQIRRAIRLWLDTREWPIRREARPPLPDK